MCCTNIRTIENQKLSFSYLLLNGIQCTLKIFLLRTAANNERREENNVKWFCTKDYSMKIAVLT